MRHGLQETSLTNKYMDPLFWTLVM